MKFVETPLPGCLEIDVDPFDDERGRFVKVFHEETFRQRGLATVFAEQYYTTSRRGVLRGMHFQLPPHEHVKLVYCLRGEALDAVVDLRRGSPTFGRHWTVILSGERGNGIYIPPGLAHGFCVTGEEALLAYRVTTPYAPSHDAGIRWDSVGVAWPTRTPILSDRDLAHPAMNAFESPFRYEA